MDGLGGRIDIFSLEDGAETLRHQRSKNQLRPLHHCIKNYHIPGLKERTKNIKLLEENVRRLLWPWTKQQLPSSLKICKKEKMDNLDFHQKCQRNH